MSKKFLIVGILLILIIPLSVLVYVLLREYQENKNWFATCLEHYEVSNKITISNDTIESKEQDGTLVGDTTLDYNPKLTQGYLLFKKGMGEEEIHYLNTYYFSDITRVSVHNDEHNTFDTTTIGTYKKSQTDELTPREITTFLLKNGLITTFDHIGSEICLYKEKTDRAIYTAHFRGEHEWCTNECYAKKYEFSISINKSDGTITVSK